MRNKPSKLYILLNEQDAPYRVAGAVRAYNSPGRAIAVRFTAAEVQLIRDLLK